MEKLYIMGCGGHARSIADTYLQRYPNAELFFVDQNARPNERVLGFILLPKVDVAELQENPVFIGIGDNTSRAASFEQFHKQNLATIISASAYISPSANISRGCFVGNFCHIGPEAFVGENTILNTGSVIEHGVRIGRHSHLAPNVSVSGNTTIGNHVFVGVGASIIDKLNICDHVIIGAGSCVIKDITVPGTYAGTPVKKIK
jgi:UDP-N-acetylbacillosamine N-acetyltransferase